MSLNARDRQALDRIEEELSGADPRFAARLSAFSRLADGEGMPARERIRPRRQRIGPFFLSRLSRRSTVGVVWLAISLMLFTVAIALSHLSAGSGCAQWQGLSCAQRSVPSAPPATGGHAASWGPGRG